MNFLIVEDEPLAAERLAELILQYEAHINIVAILDSVETAVAWLKDNPAPDLMFLDIQLADGLSFRIFEEVKITAPVIFTTAYDEYAIRAFKVNSVDYLLKPLDFDELADALDKFVNFYWKKSNPMPQVIDLEAIREAMAGVKHVYKSRFVVKKGEHLLSVPVDEILYFYSEDKITLFRTTENKRYMIEEILGELEAKLDPMKFFRINRKYIVCHPAIVDIIAFSNRRLKVKLTFSDERDILVSREKVAAFKDWLNS